ncbi:hypothetical protein Lal_00018299 [Lupinus albus]|nr:hypothetical protein Lal_00018299 [Lupinus albus]
MLAFGLTNIVGSFTSCYLTSGPFSKTDVNYNAECKTPMSNIVQTVLIAVTLLFLSRLSERFSPERERITWEGEILGYTGGFSPERELSRLGEKWQFWAVDTM